MSSVSVHEHRCLIGLYLQPRSLLFYLYSSQISLLPVSNTSPNFIISKIELLSPSKPLPPKNKTETGLVLFQGLHSVTGTAVQPSRNVTPLSCPCSIAHPHHPWKDRSLAVSGFGWLFCIPTTHWFSRISRFLLPRGKQAVLHKAWLISPAVPDITFPLFSLSSDHTVSFMGLPLATG